MRFNYTRKNRGRSVLATYFGISIRNAAKRRALFASFLACALVLSTAIPAKTSTIGTLVQEDAQKLVGEIIIDPNATIRGSIGGSVSSVPQPNAFSVAFNFGELSQVNQNTVVTITPTTGRITYPTTLANVAAASPVMIRGQSLPPQGAAFDLIMVAAPQFYIPGNVSFTFTLALQSGSSFTCP